MVLPRRKKIGAVDRKEVSNASISLKISADENKWQCLAVPECVSIAIYVNSLSKLNLRYDFKESSRIPRLHENNSRYSGRYW